MRKLASSFLVITICIISFVMPFLKASQISYAAGDVSSWYQVTTTEQAAEAFRYYCKSRDLTIEGSALDVLTSFTTQTYTDLCRGVGVNMDAIQADLKYTTDQNGNVKFLLNASGISTFNRLFSQFLQDHELEVGDSIPEDDPITLYNGELFTDDNGNSCLVTYYTSETNATNIVKKGSAYIFDFSTLCNEIIHDSDNSYVYPAVINGNTYNLVGYFNRGQCYCNIQSTGAIYLNKYNSDKTQAPANAFDGFISVGKIGTRYYLGFYTESITGKDYPFYWEKISISGNNSKSANIFIYSPTTINNNTYEGNTYTTINNEGDTNNYYIDTEPDPDDPIGPDPGPGPGPDPGGGYDPYPGGGGTTTDPDQTGGGDGDDDTTVTFPNFNFDLPSINWSLGDLSQKFPFSIPFDLIAFFTVLNAEPEAPAIDANIPLGDWYTWNFKADFSQFDNYAVIIRNVEFIAFCVGLIYLTIKFVKG